MSGLRLCIDPIWPRGLHSSSLNSDQHTRNSSTAPPSLLQSPRRSTPNGAAATRSLQTGPSRRQATAARYPVALQSMAAPIAGPPRAWKSADRHCAIGGKEESSLGQVEEAWGRSWWQKSASTQALHAHPTVEGKLVDFIKQCTWAKVVVAFGLSGYWKQVSWIKSGEAGSSAPPPKSLRRRWCLPWRANVANRQHSHGTYLRGEEETASQRGVFTGSSNRKTPFRISEKSIEVE